MRLALSSDLSREHIAQDLGGGSSTLKTWGRDAQKHDTVVSNTVNRAALLGENDRECRNKTLL
ncbi:transposase [Neokomagataea tanensis NBRC 106556]|uniref:Transposase n=1 Tax=Neokomagataea tanensis NBRC 106556 TaxID=1223519 RepID=A0ABQ0QGV1_9PROT|nr:transposase [Neokomagataea tanensis NBRC 106556]